MRNDVDRLYVEIELIFAVYKNIRYVDIDTRGPKKMIFHDYIVRSPKVL